jgi:Family of unknown function (DUF6492)
MIFDIVIPVGPDDIEFLDVMLNCTKKNVIGYRNIYVIPYDPNIKRDDCIIINENIFPFNKSTLGEYTNDSPRTPWYLQQLLKLYAGFCIPDILNNYLVIDADTFFMNPTTFFDGDIPLYNFSVENHIPYFDHMKLLHPSLKKHTEHSGICHHMVFQRNIVRQLFDMVEEYTKDVFWKSFMKCLDKEKMPGSGASEYEIYFNYLLIHHSDKIKLRELKWMNSYSVIYGVNYDPNLNYVCCHIYHRR